MVTAVLVLTGCANQVVNPETTFSRQIVITVAENSAVSNQPVEAGNVMTDEGLETIQIRISEILTIHGLKKVAQWSIKALGIEAVLAEVKDKRSTDDVIQALKKDLRVESVEQVKTYKTLSYNDPYFGMQAGSLGDDVERVHELATGRDIKVAVVDTGIDRQHPELSEKIVHSENFVSHDPVRFDEDEHGTAVAGIIAAKANNKLGIVGVAPNVGLMALKACSQNRISAQATCDSYSLMKALVKTLELQPDIVNLSLSGPDDSLIRRLLQAADRQGIVIVAAAENGSGSFPASMPEVIAVSIPVAEEDKFLPSGSVLAPGVDVLTTSPGSAYSFKSGSSLSTAYVSGVTALIMELHPKISRLEIQQTLAVSVDQSAGLPVIRLCEAISNPQSQSICSAPTAVAGAVDRQTGTD